MGVVFIEKDEVLKPKVPDFTNGDVVTIVTESKVNHYLVTFISSKYSSVVLSNLETGCTFLGVLDKDDLISKLNGYITTNYIKEVSVTSRNNVTTTLRQ